METQEVATTQEFSGPPLSITEAASEQVRLLLGREGMTAQNGALRIKVVGGGCSGYSYDMYMDDEFVDEDIFVEAHGVRIVTDPMSLTFIEGTEIDYHKTLTQEGFRFQNPKAESTCGCGISFSA